MGKRHQAGLGLKGGEKGLDANSCCCRDLIVVPFPDQDTHTWAETREGRGISKSHIRKQKAISFKKKL